MPTLKLPSLNPACPFMLLSPARGRGGERGRHAVGLTLPIRFLCGTALQMERVAEGACNPLSPPLPLAGERSMSPKQALV